MVGLAGGVGIRQRLAVILRVLSLVDGVSLLVLLYFSIYEKRMMGNEEAIRVPGTVHGLIFLSLCAALGWWVWKRRLAVKVAGLVFGGAFVPFAPFWIDGVLKRQESGGENF